MSPSADLRPAPRARSISAVRAVAGTMAVGTLLLGVPCAAMALPAGTSAPVVVMAGPVVAFYAGTAEVDGSTTLEPTTTGSKSRLDCTILFGKDSDVLRPGAGERLRRLADQLHTQGAGRIAIAGYTDDLGSAAHGLELSRRRARRVADELRQVLPTKRFPITVRGLGEAHPAVPNTSEANRRKNRRVVVTLTRQDTTPPPPKASSPAPTRTPAATPTPAAGATVSAAPAPTPTATTSLAAPPPPEPPRPASPTTPPGRTPLPWPWIGGAGAALIGLGALADQLRRRNRPRAEASSDKRTATPPDDHGVTPAAAPDSHRSTGQENAGPALARAIPNVQQDRTGHYMASPAFTPTAQAAEAGKQVRLGVASGQPALESRNDLELAADLEAWKSADTHRPRLSLLGPVHARTRGKALARRRPYYTELFAYLALRPGGATVDDIADAFNLTPARVRTDMKILRDWLGADPHTGTAYLPDARTTPAALRRGVAVYQLEGTLCDWHLFTRLQSVAGQGSDDEKGVNELQTALGLVTGRPFDQARPAGWGWLFEGDRVDLHATRAVTDIAVQLVDYHRAHHDEDAVVTVVEIVANLDPEKARELSSGTRS